MPGMPDIDKSWIMHASLKGGGVDLMASDSPKASDKAAKVELSLAGTDESEMRKIFNALAEGGKVTMPLEKQFWGDTFGMLTDKYGVDWMMNIGSNLA
jgi:PhnB protein